MLYIDFNIPEDELAVPGPLYDTLYEKEWFDDPVLVKAAEKIDGVKHLINDIFSSDVLGTISSTELSGGFKTVALAYMGETGGFILPLSWLGENCFPVLGEMDIKKDVVFDGNSFPELYDFKCDFISKRTGATLNNFDSYRKEFVDYVIRDNNSEAQIPDKS